MSKGQIRSIEEITKEIERMQNALRMLPATEIGFRHHIIGRIAGLCFAIHKKTNPAGEVMEDE